MLDLVRNPEDQFSRIVEFLLVILLCTFWSFFLSPNGHYENSSMPFTEFLSALKIKKIISLF